MYRYVRYCGKETLNSNKPNQTLHCRCSKMGYYIDLQLEFDEDGKLFTRLYDIIVMTLISL